MKPTNASSILRLSIQGQLGFGGGEAQSLVKVTFFVEST